MNNRVLKAITWDIGGSLIVYLFQFFTTIILARLLSPSDFGIVAMSMVAISIFSAVANLGLKDALIQYQNKEESSSIYHTVFNFSIFFSTLLFIVIYLIAPKISDFYNEPSITEIVRLLSFSLFLNGFNIIPIVILTKELDFKSLNIRTVVANLIASLVGMLLAFKGFGVYALIYQYLIGIFISTILIWNLINWKPKFIFKINDIKILWDFSIFSFFSQMTRIIVTKMDDLVIGKLFSSTVLGYFGRANSLVNIISSTSAGTINRVFFPFLSELQSDKNKFDTIYLQIYGLVAFLSFLLSGLLIISGEILIIQLFGIKWKPSVWIFQILVFKTFTFPGNSFLIVALLAKGYANANFYHGLVRKAAKLSTFLFAYLYDLQAFLIAVVIVGYLSVIYNNVVNSFKLKISLKKQLYEFLSFFLLFVFCLILVYGINIEGLKLTETIIRCTIFFLAFIILSFLFRKNFFLNLKNISSL